MRRREFIALVGGAVIAEPWRGSAQEAGRTYRLGWLGSTHDSSTEPYSLGFVKRLYLCTWSASLAEAESHHPDISFRWGYARVSLQTKKIKGLHKNDFILAAKVDRLFDDAKAS